MNCSIIVIQGVFGNTIYQFGIMIRIPTKEQFAASLLICLQNQKVRFLLTWFPTLHTGGGTCYRIGRDVKVLARGDRGVTGWRLEFAFQPYRPATPRPDQQQTQVQVLSPTRMICVNLPTNQVFEVLGIFVRAQAPSVGGAWMEEPASARWRHFPPTSCWSETLKLRQLSSSTCWLSASASAGPSSRSKPVPGDGFCLGLATLKDLPLCLNGLLGGTYGWGRGLLNLEFQQETVVALLIWHSLSESICFICCNSDLMTIMQNNKLRHISWLYCVRPFNSDIFRYWTYHTKGLFIR